MTLCEHCEHASYRGYRRDGYPSTIYFWCEMFNSHHQRRECEGHVEGEPKRYDKHGELMEVKR